MSRFDSAYIPSLPSAPRTAAAQAAWDAECAAARLAPDHAAKWMGAGLSLRGAPSVPPSDRIQTASGFWGCPRKARLSVSYPGGSARFTLAQWMDHRHPLDRAGMAAAGLRFSATGFMSDSGPVAWTAPGAAVDAYWEE